MFLDICEALVYDGVCYKAALNLAAYKVEGVPTLENGKVPEYILIEGINQIACRLTALVYQTNQLVVPVQIRDLQLYKGLNLKDTYFLVATFDKEKAYNRVTVCVVDRTNQHYAQGVILTSVI